MKCSVSSSPPSSSLMNDSDEEKPSSLLKNQPAARHKRPIVPTHCSDFFRENRDSGFDLHRKTAPPTSRARAAATSVVNRYSARRPRTSRDSSYVTPGKKPIRGLNAKI